MNKKVVKKILLSMQTFENSEAINYYLGKVDLMSDTKIENITKTFTEEQLKEYINQKISARLTRDVSNFKKANSFFEYGISGDCIHLHLPGDFHHMFNTLGKTKASATIAKSLIDAVKKINTQRENGETSLKDCSKIYMLSPIFYSPTFYPSFLRYKLVRYSINFETPIFKLFRLMGLKTNTYTCEQLQDLEFLNNVPEAQNAVKHFGKTKDIGSVSLDFETFNSKKFQKKLKKVSCFLDRLLENEKERI